MGILPKLLGNQRREYIFDYDPLILILLYDTLALEGSLSALAADEVSEVGFVFEHFVDGGQIPRIRIAGVCPARLLCLICGGGNHLSLGQHTGNFVVAVPMICSQLEDFLHNRCGHIVDFEHMLVLFGFAVAVWCVCADELAVGCFGDECLPRLAGAISREEFVEHVLDRHHQIIVEVSVGGVHVIADGDEADAHAGEDFAHVAADLDVVASEAREIFYDDGVDHAVFCVLHHLLEAWAVEIRSREAVVTVIVVDDNSVIPAIIAEDFHLCFDGYAHAVLIVIIAQPAVASCDCFALLSFVHVFLRFGLSKAIGLMLLYHRGGMVVNPIA